MSPTHLSRFEAGLRTVSAYVQAYNRHDPAGVIELLAEDCLIEPEGPDDLDTTITGSARIAAHYETHFARFRECRLHIEDVFGFGLQCVLRWRRTWTDDAGRQSSRRGVDLFEIRGGRISVRRGYAKWEP